MAQAHMDTGNMQQCLDKVLHHVSGHKPQLVLRSSDPEAALEFRFEMIRHEVTEVLARLQRIRNIAERGGHPGLDEVLGVLNEEFEYGRPLPPDSEAS